MDEVRQPLVVRQCSLLHVANPLVDDQRRFLVVEQSRRIRRCLLLQVPELRQSSTEANLVLVARSCLRRKTVLSSAKKAAFAELKSSMKCLLSSTFVALTAVMESRIAEAASRAS